MRKVKKRVEKDTWREVFSREKYLIFSDGNSKLQNDVAAFCVTNSCQPGKPRDKLLV